MLRKVFRVLSTIFSSKSIQTLSALRALRLVTRLAVSDVAKASYDLFKTTMAYENMTDQHWAAARLAIHGALQEGGGVKPSKLGELKEIFKFLDYHLGLQGAGEDRGSSIRFALGGILAKSRGRRPDPLVVKCIKKFDCASPSFVGGMRSILRPGNHITLRGRAVGLITYILPQHPSWSQRRCPNSVNTSPCSRLTTLPMLHASRDVALPSSLECSARQSGGSI